MLLYVSCVYLSLIEKKNSNTEGGCKSHIVCYLEANIFLVFYVFVESVHALFVTFKKKKICFCMHIMWCIFLPFWKNSNIELFCWVIAFIICMQYANTSLILYFIFIESVHKLFVVHFKFVSVYMFMLCRFLLIWTK